MSLCLIPDTAIVVISLINFMLLCDRTSTFVRRVARKLDAFLMRTLVLHLCVVCIGVALWRVDGRRRHAAAEATAAAANSNSTRCTLFIGSIISMHLYAYHGHAVSTSQYYRCSDVRFYTL